MAIDYAAIGRGIREQRIQNRLTQEKLAELVGIGPSHMSHLESGRTVASMEVFIALCNALNCSADTLLCREISSDQPLVRNWLTELVADCDQTEVKIISDMVVALKESLRKNKPSQ